MVDRGNCKLIRVDGTEEVFPMVAGPRFLSGVARTIGADCLDTVILTRSHGQADVVMLVDDTGMVDGKPINPLATDLYHNICTPGNPHSIHGDVVLVHDGDFS